MDTRLLSTAELDLVVTRARVIDVHSAVPPRRDMYALDSAICPTMAAGSLLRWWMIGSGMELDRMLGRFAALALQCLRCGSKNR